MGKERRESQEAKRQITKLQKKIRQEQRRAALVLPHGVKLDASELEIPKAGMVQKHATGPVEDEKYSKVYNSMVVVRMTHFGEDDTYAKEAVERMRAHVEQWHNEEQERVGERSPETNPEVGDDPSPCPPAGHPEVELPMPNESNQEG